MPPVTRPITLEDAAPLSRLLVASREFLAPWEPVRGERYATEAGQREAIATVLEARERGTEEPHVVLDERGEVAGRVTLSGIVRGPFLSCHVGYWLAEHATGRGLATAAVAAMLRVAYDDLGLHRVQAATLLHNHRSEGVLRRNGFEQIGMAPAYLQIAGRWQDHLLFQAIAPD